MNDNRNRKMTGPLQRKMTGSLVRKYPDLAQNFESLGSLDKEPLEKEPLEKIEAPVWREIRILVAAKLYGAGSLSSERAARLAGLSHVEFILNLGFYKIFPLQAELTELEKLNE